MKPLVVCGPPCSGKVRKLNWWFLEWTYRSSTICSSITFLKSSSPDHSYDIWQERNGKSRLQASFRRDFFWTTQTKRFLVRWWHWWEHSYTRVIPPIKSLISFTLHFQFWMDERQKWRRETENILLVATKWSPQIRSKYYTRTWEDRTRWV